MAHRLLVLRSRAYILSSMFPCMPSMPFMSLTRPMPSPLLLQSHVPSPASYHHRPILSQCSPSPSGGTAAGPPSQDLDDYYALDTFSYGYGWYWDQRYARDSEPFEWYLSYADIAPFMKKHIPTSSRVLMVGCGNAGISEDMVKDGYQEIVNIDISPVVIEAMQKKYCHVPQLKYMTMDVQDLCHFGDSTFDSVIDKGCLDAMMCGKNADLCISNMLAEVSRVLKPGGVYFLIICGDPRLRLLDLNKEEYHWTTSLYIIPEVESKEALEGCTKAFLEPMLVNFDDDSKKLVPEDRDPYFIYTCIKITDVH